MWPAVATALSFAGPSAAHSVDRWSGYIAEASERFAVPEGWIRRVMQAERGGRTMLNGKPVTSRAGAMGPMQLMPGTWREMRSAHGLGPDPHDPRDNILAGTAYLRAMYERFGYSNLFAAYNAGPARFAGHLASGRRLPAETMAYAAAVGGTPPQPRALLSKSVGASGVFVALGSGPPRGGRIEDGLGLRRPSLRRAWQAVVLAILVHSGLPEITGR